MSGIVATLNLDGTPVDAGTLSRLTDAVAFRGPDHQAVWSSGPVGFGHALLATTSGPHARQPARLNQTWITADARIDGRSDLLNLLRAKGCDVADAASDAELLLHAYATWGEQCVRFLIGDFSFVLWDARHQRLFCARDHYGVAQLYYAIDGSTLVLSNVLNCARLHAGAGDDLNERAIGDFLLFGFNRDEATTTFADVQRLRPAHTLTWSADRGLRLERYWSPPDADWVRYRQPAMYVEHFRELFDRAVADRLRIRRVGTHLSGGLDSSSITAVAHRHLSAAGAGFELRAYTMAYRRLIADDEEHYASAFSSQLGIEHEVIGADEFVEASIEAPQCNTPEPGPALDQLAELEILRRAAGHSPVLLHGFGGDPALYPDRRYWPRILRRGRMDWVAVDLWRHMWAFGRLPPLYVRSALRARRRGPMAVPLRGFEPGFTRRGELEARFREAVRMTAGDPRSGMAGPYWSNLFALADPSHHGLPVQSLFPFFDVRLTAFLTSVPAYPWLENKYLLRQAMCGVLPESIRQRPKTALQGDPYAIIRRHGTPAWQIEWAATPELGAYVDCELLQRHLRSPLSVPLSWSLRNRSLLLAGWLRSQRQRSPATAAGNAATTRRAAEVASHDA